MLLKYFVGAGTAAPTAAPAVWLPVFSLASENQEPAEHRYRCCRDVLPFLVYVAQVYPPYMSLRKRKIGA